MSKDDEQISIVEGLSKIKMKDPLPKAPEGVTCFACVYCAGGTFGPDGFSAKCVIGHRWGGCCKMVSKTCGMYEMSDLSEQYNEQETGKKAHRLTSESGTYEYTKRYVHWLEAKVLAETVVRKELTAKDEVREAIDVELDLMSQFHKDFPGITLVEAVVLVRNLEAKVTQQAISINTRDEEIERLGEVIRGLEGEVAGLKEFARRPATLEAIIDKHIAQVSGEEKD